MRLSMRILAAACLSVALPHGLCAEDAAPPDLKKRQSLAKGLLLAELSASNFAARASQMNATAIQNGAGEPATVKFNQEVGPAMEKALHEVRKYLSVRHKQWPQGYDIEISFEDKYQPKDGPSAAVACALMIESLIAGTEIDPKFAVTGDLNADGSVQPVGGVADKIRGASRDCQIVAIPSRCETQVLDAVLDEGLAPLINVQVLLVSSFDEALAASAPTRPPALAGAVATFAEVQTVLRRQQNPAPMLANPHVQGRLRKVLAAAPNHLSASALLRAGLGRLPKKFSLAGALAQIDKSTDFLLRAIRTEKTDALSPDEVAGALSKLSRLRPNLDQRTWRYADTLVDFGEAVRAFRKQPPRTDPEILKALERIRGKARLVDGEIDKIRSNKALMEEMMR
jgi:hypothetical protein